MSDDTRPALVVGHPTKPLVYSSTAITERRRRILKEARLLIAELGPDGFGIRDLSQRAHVAQRTLYNAFLNKDRIIALAIREAYEEANERIQYKSPATTLDGILERLRSINMRNFSARNYTKAVTALYFSPTTSEDIVRSLRDMAFLNLRLWLDEVESRRELAEWIRRRELELNLVNMEYAIINDWARGLIADADYIPRLLESILIVVAGATLGQTRNDAERHLTNLRVAQRVKQPRAAASKRRSNSPPTRIR